MSATAFQRMRREALAKAKAKSEQEKEEHVEEPIEGVTVNVINLESMSVEELTQYAEDNRIDIGKATSKEGILKKIFDATNEDEKEVEEQ